MDRDGTSYASISELLEDLLQGNNAEQRHTSSSNEAAFEEEQSSSNPPTEPPGASKRPVDLSGSSGATNEKKTRTQSPSEPTASEGMIVMILMTLLHTQSQLIIELCHVPASIHFEVVSLLSIL